MITLDNLREISPCVWEIPKSFRSDMRVPARIYCSREMLEALLSEHSLEQAVNVSTLQGIQGYSIAMPDIHQGYGFPIGGVAAIRTADGVISPGGVGYDINCGVRLLKSAFHAKDLREKIEPLANQMQRDIPSGVGRGGEFKLDHSELNKVLNKGLKWAVKRGYAFDHDPQAIEEYGTYAAADAEYVSAKAKERGLDQLGTLGSGNHFVEIQEVLELQDADLADAFGLFQGQACVMIHTGSRGLGHQVCTDYVQLMNKVMPKYGIQIPDRELASAPFRSDEGQQYFRAMAAAANFAWVNRQIITHQTRSAWKRVLGSREAGALEILYDVAHNIAKLEQHDDKEYIVHRKGATRAFGPGAQELSEQFRESGQPVLIPGSMGTFSYVLCGTAAAMQETFGSTCHGAGRKLSRMKAKKTLDYNKLVKQLKDYGVVVRAGSASGLLEEAPQAYKDVDSVVSVVQASGISRVVAKLKPLAVIKG